MIAARRSTPLKHGYSLVENLLEGHRPSPLCDAACSRRCGKGKSRSGSLYRKWVTKGSRKSSEHMTQR